MLFNQRPAESEQTLRLTAVMLSWGIYGASVEWRRDSKKIQPEGFIKSAIPYIISGI
ncbi:hypothetical protein D3C78_1907310 [compost metagenome]